MSQSVNMWWENNKEPRIEPCGTPNVKAFLIWPDLWLWRRKLIVTSPIPHWEQSGGGNCYVTCKTKIGASEVLSKRQAVRFGSDGVFRTYTTFLTAPPWEKRCKNFQPSSFSVVWKMAEQIFFDALKQIQVWEKKRSKGLIQCDISDGRSELDATPGTLTSRVWVSNCNTSVWTRLVLKCVPNSQYQSRRVSRVGAECLVGFLFFFLSF